MRGLSIDSRLEAIAGKPAGMQVGPGTTGPLEGFTALGDRTLYFVWRKTGINTKDAPVALLGRDTSNSVALGTLSTLSRNYFAVRDGTNTFKNQTFTDLGVFAGFIATYDNNGGVTAGVLGMPSESWTSGRVGGSFSNPPVITLASESAIPTSAGLIAAAYPAVHTEYQRTAIMRKLLQMSGA